jgi:hypothetical protein
MHKNLPIFAHFIFLHRVNNKMEKDDTHLKLFSKLRVGVSKATKERLFENDEHNIL